MVKSAIYFLLLLSFQFVSYSAHAEASSEADWAYTIKPHDTFYSIYRAYLANQSDIAKLSKHNQHKLTQKLHPGQVLNIPVTMLKKTPARVQVLVASGDVMCKLSTQNNEQKVKKGDVLAQGDILKTGKYSVAKLSFADGSVVDVQQNSNIEIVANYQYAGKATYVTLLKLANGRTEIGANPSRAAGNRLQVQTPSAIAAVRGTHFRVTADENVASQETLEGKVAFSAAGQEVLLTQGYGSLAEKNQVPLAPIALPSPPDVSHLPKNIESYHGQVSFLLNPHADAIATIALLAKDAEFTQIVSEVATKNTQLNIDIPSDGTYHLRLRAQELHGLQGGDATHTFNVTSKMQSVVESSKFNLISPSDATVIELAPTSFSWSAMPQAQQYLLQIARDAHFKDVIFEQPTTESQWITRQSFGKGQYYWRVAVVTQGKPTQFSEIRTFSR